MAIYQIEARGQRGAPPVFVVREYLIVRGLDYAVPGREIGCGASVAEARKQVPWEAGVCYPRIDTDPPSVVETWM